MEEYQKKLAAMKALREQSQKTLPTNSSNTTTTTPKPTTATTTTNPPLVKNPSNSSFPNNNFNNSAPKPSTLQKSGSNLSLSSTNSTSSTLSSSGSSATNVSSSTPSSPSVSRTAFSLSSASSQSRLRTGSAPVAPPSSSTYTPHTVGYNLPSKNSPSSTSSSSLSNFKPSTPSTPSTPTPSITTTPSSPSLSSSSTTNSAPSTPTATETTQTTQPTTPTRSLITRTGSVSASSSPVLSRSGSVGASNAPLPVKSELDDVKQKLELETKLRYEAERKYQEKVRELATVKMQMQKNALAEMSKGVSRPPGAGGSSSGSSLLNASKDPTRQSVRMSKRVSVRPNGSNLALGGMPPGAGGPPGGSGSRLSVRPNARRSTMVVANQLTSLVSEITKIEVAVTAAHAAREEAEQRLYDICVEKLMVDGVLKKVVQNLFGVEAGLRSVTDPKVSKARNEIVESIAYAVKECGLDITMPGTPSSDSSPSSSIPTPPANPNSSSKPPPPPPMTAARSLAATQVVVGGGSQASLLDQIRGGKSLKQIDLQKLKEERTKSDKNKRKSMLQLKSLTDTLREALFARADDLLGADEEEDEDDEDWME